MATKNIFKILFTLILLSVGNLASAQSLIEDNNPNEATYLKSVINTNSAIELQKSTIFDASQSFIPDTNRKIEYEWNFGDGNRNEGAEVLHAYKEPGYYTITLTLNDGINSSQDSLDVFVYRKLIILITDQTEDQDRIKNIKASSEKKGVYLKLIESFGSSTEFISEEILAKKITEEANNLQKTRQIVIWTKENAGLNALSRYIQNNVKKGTNAFTQKTIIILENDVGRNLSRIQRQFELINPKTIIVAKEGAIDPLIESSDEDQFLSLLKEKGYEFAVVDAKSGKLRPWNFISYFVNILVDNGIPDNTIALLLLLPVIATVVAFMRQVVGITTFGIYTPSIITLSFLIIGIQAGLLTLLAAIGVGILTKPLLKRVRMLFVPKMAIVLTVVSFTLLLILISGIKMDLFNAQFVSIAIFPMLILGTLVEKFMSTKTESGFSTATVLMGETLLVSIVAYFIAGGEVDLWFFSFKLGFIKNLMLTYPEIVILLLIINIALGKWSGLRVLERIRFREVLRHIEE